MSVGKKKNLNFVRLFVDNYKDGERNRGEEIKGGCEAFHTKSLACGELLKTKSHSSREAFFFAIAVFFEKTDTAS